MKAVEKIEAQKPEVVEQRLAIQDIAGLKVLQEVRVERLELESVGAAVFLRSPPASRRREFEKGIIQSSDPRLTPKIDFCAFCLSDEKGEFLFPNLNDKSKIEEGLGEVDSRAIEEIFRAVMKITKIDDQVIENRQKK